MLKLYLGTHLPAKLHFANLDANYGNEENERKGHPAKESLHGGFGEKMRMSLKWIAETLNMGIWIHISFLLHRPRYANNEPIIVNTYEE